MVTRVRVRYFASLREALGPGEEVELPADTRPIIRTQYAGV